MQTLSNQGKPKRKQRATIHLVTQEPDPPQPDPPSSPLPSSITSLISARASLTSATTPTSKGYPASDRQKAMPLPLPPAYDAPSYSSPSGKPPTHELTSIANSPLRRAPSFEQAPFIAKSPLRSMSSFESATTPVTPVRTAPAYESAYPAKSPLRSVISLDSAMTPVTPIRTAPAYESAIPAKSPLRNEPLISANSPLRMLPSYQRRIISPSASPMKQTPHSNGNGEYSESRHQVFESRPNALGAPGSRNNNKGAEPRTSPFAGLESMRSKNGAFSSMDLMRRDTGAGSSQPGSARKRDAVAASPVTKREKENVRSTLREGRR